MQVVVAFRGWDMWRWREQTRQTSYDGKRQIARFSKGALTQAVGWGMFPLFFFHEIGQMDRAAMAIILSAMASGAVTVLSPSLRLAVQFCMFLLLSPSFMFLLEGGRANGVLGFLGVMFCAILIQLAHVPPGDPLGHPDE